ncbi:porin [Candidatus Finniella inopinata]|nr:porin [Candidatus Finniella inopinata]
MTKKFKTLSTTLLLSGVFLTSVQADPAPASGAQAPTFKINGYTIVTAAMANQQRTDNGKGGSDPFMAVGPSDLYFTIVGKSSNSLEYKYRINFETYSGSSSYVARNYIEFNGNFGTIQAGNLKGPEDAMPESGMNLVGGAGGIDGTLGSVYNNSAGVIDGVYFAGYTNKTTKFVFYSPTVMGFQLGFAYTPNTSHMGKEGRNNAANSIAPGVGTSSAIYPDKANSPYGTRNIVLGLSYTGSADLWSWDMAVVGVTEQSHLVYTGSQGQIPVNNARSYQLTAAVGYDKWRVAAGWIDNGKSRIVKNNNSKTGPGAYLADTYLGNAGKAWNAGASYTVGAYQFAAAYHRTDRKTDATNSATSDILVTTVDLSALQGLKFFGEVDFVKTRTNNNAVTVQQNYLNTAKKDQKAVGNNSATVFLVGSKVSF